MLIISWGILDLSAFGWYAGWRLFHGQIPFYYDISNAIKTNASFGMPSLTIITIFSLFLYISLVFSGILLIKRNKTGAILSYIQTPFRIFSLIPPSFFFITWPLKYIFDEPKTISAITTFATLVLLSEFLKMLDRQQIVTRKSRYPDGVPWQSMAPQEYF